MPYLWFALLRKELRSLTPFLALIVALPLLGLAMEGVTQVPHLRSWAEIVREYTADSAGEAAFRMLIVLALASGLLVREFDDGTIEFLDALPVTRGQVFLGKLAAALLVLGLGEVVSLAGDLLLQTIARNSLDPALHLDFSLTAAALWMGQYCVFLALGLALSFLRRFGWLVLGLVVWLYILLVEIVPAARVLDVLAIATPHFEGRRWVLPTSRLVVQLGLAAGLLAVSYVLFVRADAWLRAYARFAQRRRGQIALGCGTVALVVVGGALATFAVSQFAGNDGGDEEVSVAYAPWPTARARTRHYEFLYPTNLADRARLVFDDADDVHEKVRKLLGAEPVSERIAVDMTGQLARHAGQAFWEKIRMPLTESESRSMLRAILGHETAHVLIERLSDHRLSDSFSYARFFHEGVATYVECTLFEPEPGLEAWRSVAAVMRARREVDFAELVDDDRLRRRRDPDLVYPLGEVFVAALVRRYGEASIGRLCRALARPEAPRDLAGRELWYDTFQSCGYSLDAVIDEFFRLLDEEVERHREWIDRLPRLRGTVTIDDLNVQIEVAGELLEDWRAVCRFRTAPDDDDRRYLFGIGVDERRFLQPRFNFTGPSCGYQLGQTDGQGRTVWEPWVEVTLSQTRQ